MFLAKKPLTVWKDLMQFKRVKQAPAAECSSGMYMKVNRDTGNTFDRTPPGTGTVFIIQYSGRKSKAVLLPHLSSAAFLWSGSAAAQDFTPVRAFFGMDMKSSG